MGTETQMEKHYYVVLVIAILWSSSILSNDFELQLQSWNKRPKGEQANCEVYVTIMLVFDCIKEPFDIAWVLFMENIFHDFDAFRFQAKG